ncbi:MAG: sigma-70 family RNA polymerase sigma factor [Clostridia bacterium]|nr:sigma-70 family RNA polymerase sigma factor [Clostridia bacterium]
MNSAQFNALIRQAKKKDEQAVIILNKFCINVILRHLSLKFNSRQEVEDWAHDVFAYRILPNLPDKFIDYPVAWLYKIADNYVYTELKKQNRTLEYRDDICSDKEFVDLYNKYTLEEVFKDEDELTVKILILNLHYGYTFDEIAILLKVKPATARQRASRAKRKIRSDVTKPE